MKPDIVYLHTGLDLSRVSALWVSVFTVKRTSSSLRVRCVVSEDEVSELDAMIPSFLKGFIEWSPVRVPPGNPSYRSRWIKTQLYRWLAGPSLFIDSDTLLVRTPNWSDLNPFTFATAINRIADNNFKEVPSRIVCKKRFAVAGWEWDSRLDGFYRNSGVMYIVPGRKVEALFEAWHQKWSEYTALSGQHVDQPSLNLVLLEQGWVERLPDRWNAPVRVLPATSRDALIQHYYSSAGMNQIASFTLYGTLLRMMQEGRFDPEEAGRMLDRKQVYIGMGGRIKEYMLAGQYDYMFKSILQKGRRLFHARVY
jgi:hypothetical protein